MKRKLPDLILTGVFSSCLLTLACSKSGSVGAAVAPQRTLPEVHAVAQEAGLFMAGTDMRLGMPQEPLLAKLKENYILGTAGANGWTIFEKKGPPYKLVGVIGFNGGRLTWISKDWGNYDSEGTLSFGKELFSLLSSLTDKKPTPVLVDPKVSVRQPGLVISEIELLYPERTVSILIVESKKNGNSISISEVLKAQ
jgi:hypothetical protein